MYIVTVGTTNEGVLKDAFDLLQALISGVQAYSHQGKLNELQQTYQYMLHYYAEGSKDPKREQIYAGIRTGVYELADLIKHEALFADSPNAYYAAGRALALQSYGAAEFIDRLHVFYGIDRWPRYELSVSQLFNTLWTTAFLSETDIHSVRKALKQEAFPVQAKCQIVSALWLGLQMSFDKEKLNLLFDAADEANNEVRIRAMVSICLTLYTYPSRTEYYPTIRQRLDAMAEKPDFKRILTTIIFRFILARETEKVTHKLQADILPEMMKLASKVDPYTGRVLLSSELEGDEMNPEWKDIISNSKLAEKIEEYGNMQEEGVDVMLSTFIHLKHFPFFRNVSNWFLPFTTRHSAFQDQEDLDNATLETLVRASYMCNSDKYSFFFSLLQFPGEHRRALIGQMEGQIGDLKEQLEQELKSIHTNVESIAGQYVQDLYRFYKLYPHHTDFLDIFTWDLDFHLLPALKPYLSDTETLVSIAEFYLRKGYYGNAQDIYDQLMERQEGADETLYQKSGYCKQMSGDPEGALKDYLRSELLNPDSKWLIRRIADCYRLMKRPDEALKYYSRHEQLQPDVISVLIYIGHCHMEMKNYNEALKCYFKVDYLEPDSHKVWRAIAWCSFLSGRYDQSRHYYGKILSHQPQLQDFLNAGHTEWVLQQIPQAIAHYQSAVAQTGSRDGLEKFLMHFREDIPDLIRAGIDMSEILLMQDQMRYLWYEQYPMSSPT
jgi:tetratricopeptide (TPR) repeat protein